MIPGADMRSTGDSTARSCTYLDIKKSDFYQIENTVDGKSYVTARGWEDLSETMYLYEENGFRWMRR